MDIISNGAAADFLMKNVFNPNIYQPEINMAAIKGACALLLARDEEVDELCYNFMDNLYRVQWSLRKQTMQEQSKNGDDNVDET